MSIRLGLNLLALRPNQGAGVERFVRNVVGSLELGSAATLWVGKRENADLEQLLGERFLGQNQVAEVATWRCGQTGLRLFIEMILMCKKTFFLDVVLSINNFGPLLGKVGQRRVVVIHDVWFLEPEYDGHWLKKYLFGILIRLQLLTATHIVTVSEFSKRAIVRRLKVDKQIVSVVSNCVPSMKHDLDNSGRAIEVAKKVAPPFSGEYLLMVGSDRPNKNIRRGLQGYIEYVQAIEKFPALCIVGLYAETFWAKLLSIVPAHLSSKVVILGFVSDVEYEQLVSDSTGVLFPSLYEGFGIPVVEAINQGKGVLVSKGTVCEEIAGPFGVAVDTRDILQISAGIRELLGKPAIMDTKASSGGRSFFRDCEHSGRELRTALSIDRIT